MNIVLIWNSNDGEGWIRPAEHDNEPGTKVPGTASDYSGSTPRVHIEMGRLGTVCDVKLYMGRGRVRTVFNIHSRL